MKKFLLVTVSVLALSASAAEAGPLTAAVGWLASTAVTGGFAGVSFGAIAAQFAVRAALGYALNALASRPGGLSRGYSSTVNELGPALPHQIIYGEDRVGGAVVYQTTTSSGGSNQDRLHRVIAFAGHEIDSYQKIYLDDEELTIDASGNVTSPAKYSGKVRVKKYLGTDSQSADPNLVSEVSEWTTGHKLSGIAYLYVRFQDAQTFEGRVPSVSALIRGKKIRDYRNPSPVAAWSDNPSMVILDYLLSDYGLSESIDNIDTVLFGNAADVCDQDGGLYTCNGSFLLDASPEDIVRGLLSSMGGIFWNYGGNWAIQAAVYLEPTIELTYDELRGPLEVATRHSRRDNFNTVVGQYKGADTNYQPDNYTRVTAQNFLLEDNGIPATSELNLRFTNTNNMANRIAKTYLRRNRLQQTVSGSFGLEAMNLRIGDNVMLTIDYLNYNQKVFEVVDWRLGFRDLDIVVNMILREMDASVFQGVVDSLADQSGDLLLDQSGGELLSVVA